MSLLETIGNDYGNVKSVVRHHVKLPVSCCPVSHNPMEGSTLTLRYAPADCTIEVYSLAMLLERFIHGFPGEGPYPAERNMEGMIQLITQIAADTTGVKVRSRATLFLDAGVMRLTCEALPNP